MLSAVRSGALVRPVAAASRPCRRAARRAVRCAATGGDKNSNDKDALLKSLGQISKTTGRSANTNNVVLGGESSVAKWKELDEKVNEYPCQRSFKCVGVAEDGFREQMVTCVEDVIGTQVHPESVNTRPSSKGNYISVQIGPVIIKTPDQVLAIFANMKQDSRLKWVM